MRLRPCFDLFASSPSPPLSPSGEPLSSAIVSDSSLDSCANRGDAGSALARASEFCGKRVRSDNHDRKERVTQLD